MSQPDHVALAEALGEVLREERQATTAALAERDAMIADLRRELAEVSTTETRRKAQAEARLLAQINDLADDLRALLRSPPEFIPGLARPNELVILP